MQGEVHKVPSAAEFTCHWRAGDEAATRALGARAAGLLKGGEVILLHGDLGMGKTCFVQGLCADLKVREEVVSPTFTLVNTYVGRLQVEHLDFYRVEAEHDLDDIGVPDILDAAWDGESVVLVEWPGPLKVELGGTPYLELLVTPAESPDSRMWHLRGSPEVPSSWRKLFESEGNASC